MYLLLISGLSETFIKSLHDCEHTPIPIKNTDEGTRNRNKNIPSCTMLTREQMNVNPLFPSRSAQIDVIYYQLEKLQLGTFYTKV